MDGVLNEVETTTTTTTSTTTTTTTTTTTCELHQQVTNPVGGVAALLVVLRGAPKVVGRPQHVRVVPSHHLSHGDDGATATDSKLSNQTSASDSKPRGQPSVSDRK